MIIIKNKCNYVFISTCIYLYLLFVHLLPLNGFIILIYKSNRPLEIWCVLPCTEWFYRNIYHSIFYHSIQSKNAMVCVTLHEDPGHFFTCCAVIMDQTLLFFSCWRLIDQGGCVCVSVCVCYGSTHSCVMSTNEGVFSRRLNLRELGPLAAHMRWFVWLMAAAGTIYVFNYHEKYVWLHHSVLWCQGLPDTYHNYTKLINTKD